MIWLIAVLALLLVLMLYRRMLTSVTAFVPARTHLTGWGGLGVADGSDRWVFLAFVVCLFGLLALDWPLALVWLAVLAAGLEILRRRHNAEPAST